MIFIEGTQVQVERQSLSTCMVIGEGFESGYVLQESDLASTHRAIALFGYYELSLNFI